jgi:short-subunit dehydrogenase
MKKAIIIGASSGLGREMARILSGRGYCLGLAARREKLLVELQKELPEKSHICLMDIADTEKSIVSFGNLIKDMGGAELIIICAGTGHINPELDWEPEKNTIEINVLGFTAIAGAAFRHLEKNKSQEGHIVGISSIAALRGGADAPAYNASKAYMSNYLEGLRVKAKKNNQKIHITDIRPGFIDTDMAKGDSLFWVASPEKAALQALNAIERKKSCAYITKRWALIAFLLKIIPEFLYCKI